MCGWLLLARITAQAWSIEARSEAYMGKPCMWRAQLHSRMQAVSRSTRTWVAAKRQPIRACSLILLRRGVDKGDNRCSSQKKQCKFIPALGCDKEAGGVCAPEAMPVQRKVGKGDCAGELGDHGPQYGPVAQSAHRVLFRATTQSVLYC